LLIAGVAQSDIGNLESCVAGADGGLVYFSGPEGKALGEITTEVPDIPWGVWLKAGKPEKSFEQRAFDFAVLPVFSSPGVIGSEKTGKILELEPSLGDAFLRAAGELPIDAVLVGEEEAGVDFPSWYHLMLFQRFSSLVGKPLLVRAPSKVTGGELQALWEVGVDGVLVEVEAGKPAQIGKLRQVIEKLTFPSKRKRVRREALLPYPGGGALSVAEDEDEEGEEE